MKKHLLILFLLVSVVTYAQQETTNDSIISTPPDKQTQIPKLEQPDLKPFEEATIKRNPFSIPVEPSNFQPEHQSIVEKLNIYIPDFYVGPSLDFDRIPTTHPFEKEYQYYASWDVGLGERGWIGTSSTFFTYPSLGATQGVTATFNYAITDRWLLSAGPYVSKNVLNGMPFDDMGVNGNMKYILHDRIRLNVFGQYSVYGKNNNAGVQNFGMFSQTSYGGTVEFKMTDNFGIQAGVIRMLDPQTGKWKNQTIISPVFYKK